MRNSRHKRIEAMLTGYIECALWSSIDEQPDGNGGPPMDDNYGPEDVSEETMEASRKDCAAFLWYNRKDIRAFMEITGRDYPTVGHDFWLTRNGHGAGFWDRGAGEAGDRLSDAADVYGEVYLYAFDGKVLGD
jgi:hypothetical protein